MDWTPEADYAAARALLKVPDGEDLAGAIASLTQRLHQAESQRDESRKALDDVAIRLCSAAYGSGMDRHLYGLSALVEEAREALQERRMRRED